MGHRGGGVESRTGWEGRRVIVEIKGANRLFRSRWCLNDGERHTSSCTMTV